MTRGQISVGRRWVHRLFTGWSGPEAVDDVVIMTTPWEGAGRYTDLQFSGTTGTATTLTGTPIVPDAETWWVPYVSMHHDDPALTTHVFMTIQDRAGNNVTVVSGGNITADLHISIRRPIIVPEGGRVFAQLASATAAGKKVYLNCFYQVLKLGEYVPPL